MTQSHAFRPVVLIVEDEPLLLIYAADVISAAGFDVIETRNADEAIAILNERKDIKIVLTDIDMPGSMDGLKLAAAIRDRWPPVEIVVTSGMVKPKPDEMPIRGLFLPKPYQPDQLLMALRSF